MSVCCVCKPQDPRGPSVATATGSPHPATTYTYLHNIHSLSDSSGMSVTYASVGIGAGTSTSLHSHFSASEGSEQPSNAANLHRNKHLGDISPKVSRQAFPGTLCRATTPSY